MAGEREPILLTVQGFPGSDILNEVEVRLGAAQTHCKTTGRPVVTLAYAQSLDGSIASAEGKPLALSSTEALTLTHALRAAHDAILVGIGCVLADNPRLTVRLIPGRSPQPVIVDSRLRCPLSANLLSSNGTRPWIVTTEKADKARQRTLEGMGARVIRIKNPLGAHINLSTLLETLVNIGVSTIMVEGGAQIITSFLTDRLVDQVVVTIAPLLVGGLRAVRTAPAMPPGTRSMKAAPAGDAFTEGYPKNAFPRLVNTSYEIVGNDLVVRGDPDWAGP
jgi:GTP cyclohydrolase II